MDIVERIGEHYRSICAGYYDYISLESKGNMGDRRKEHLIFLNKLREGIKNAYKINKEEGSICWYSDVIITDLKYFHIAGRMFLKSWDDPKLILAIEEEEILKTLIGPTEIFAEEMKKVSEAAEAKTAAEE